MIRVYFNSAVFCWNLMPGWIRLSVIACCVFYGSIVLLAGLEVGLGIYSRFRRRTPIHPAWNTSNTSNTGT